MSDYADFRKISPWSEVTGTFDQASVIRWVAAEWVMHLDWRKWQPRTSRAQWAVLRKKGEAALVPMTTRRLIGRLRWLRRKDYHLVPEKDVFIGVQLFWRFNWRTDARPCACVLREWKQWHRINRRILAQRGCP